MIWYALDVETATRALGSLCEIAVAEFKDGRHTGKHFQSMIYPPGNVYDANIQTQYSAADTADAKQWDEISPKIAKRVGNRPVVAHNMEFDMRHLYQRQKNSGTWCPDYNNSFCSLRLARWADPFAPNHKLVTLIDHLKLPFEGAAHTALADAIGAGNVFATYANQKFGGIEQAMEQLRGNTETGTLRWLREHKEAKRPEPATSKQKNFVLRLIGDLQSISTATWQDITDIIQRDTSKETWLDDMSKLEASDLISYLKPLVFPAKGNTKRAVAALIQKAESNGQLIECDIENLPNGFFHVRYAGCSQMVLASRPPAGKEHQVFMDLASEDDMQAVREELTSRLMGT